jgi:ATP-dependent DNA helicase RecG
MPPGRQPVKTFLVSETKRHDMYGFMEKEIQKGAQIFVVCPLVEDSDALDVRSSEQVYDELKQHFCGANVALLHGRLKPQEKNDIMHRFKAKEFSILVSTTVIEVGVDVPNATIMVIENAERFGLAQLHQLRGRVGRGQKTSYCFLMSDKSDNPRLSILCKTNDGFKIAEEDLNLRGPGQFLGNKQSGMSDLYMANLIKDMTLLTQTRDIVHQIKQKNQELYLFWQQTANARFSHKLDKTVIN